MTPQQFLEHIASDSADIASAAIGHLGEPVAHLGWTVRELVAHLGAVYTFAIGNTLEPSTEAVPLGDEAQAPDGDAINEWFAERRAALLETLTRAADDAVSFTFAGVKTAEWWKRRIAQETTVHRWDIEAAINGVDAVAPIDGELATDGVDEYLEVSLRHSQSRPNRVYPSETLHLHRSDGPGEWMLASDGQGGVLVTHEHGKGDAAVRGPASDLLLWIWGRPTTGVEIFGDEAVASAWQSLAP